MCLWDIFFFRVLRSTLPICFQNVFPIFLLFSWIKINSANIFNCKLSVSETKLLSNIGCQQTGNITNSIENNSGEEKIYTKQLINMQISSLFTSNKQVHDCRVFLSFAVQVQIILNLQQPSFFCVLFTAFSLSYTCTANKDVITTP